mgnify:CR=1 FL=1
MTVGVTELCHSAYFPKTTSYSCCNVSEQTANSIVPLTHWTLPMKASSQEGRGLSSLSHSPLGTCTTTQVTQDQSLAWNTTDLRFIIRGQHWNGVITIQLAFCFNVVFTFSTAASLSAITAFSSSVTILFLFLCTVLILSAISWPCLSIKSGVSEFVSLPNNDFIVCCK